MTVAVIVPTRDRVEFLPGLLEALRHQTHADTAVVLVDDGSVDGTVAFLEHALSSLPRAQLVRGEGRGPAHARNLGVAAASAMEADWLAFTDDDCIPQPNWLEELLAAADSAGAEVVQGRTRDDRTADPRRVPWLARSKVVNGWTNRFQTCNLLVRRLRVVEVGGFDDAFPYFGEDIDLGMRLVAAGAVTTFAPAAEVDHRWVPQTFRGFVRRRWRWSEVVRAVAANPAARAAFAHPYVSQRSHVAILATLPVAAVAVGRGHAWFPLAAAAAYVGHRVYATRNSPRPFPTRVAMGCARLVGDAVESVAFVVSSVRHRTLLL